MTSYSTIVLQIPSDQILQIFPQFCGGRSQWDVDCARTARVAYFFNPVDFLRQLSVTLFFTAMDVSQEDLDNFLTIVESKLRGPFSSLDVAKAVTSTRGLTPRQYVEQLIQVFPRMDKVTKLRVLIAMLGLDPSDEHDDLIYDLFTTGIEERLAEDWVKVIAGLNRGIMYQDSDGSRESCRGEEAQQLLEKSCADVLDRVLLHKRHVDRDPLFAPYFYSLLNADVLKEVLPECLKNPHFKVNVDAAVLKEDEQFEQKKVHDGQSGTIARRDNAATNGATETKPKAQDLPTMPGINKLNKAKVTDTGKSSLFLANKKPTVARPGQLVTQFNALRKPGTSRAILTKGRRPGLPGPAGSTGTTSAKFGASRSKMMMVDLAEVKDLQVEAKQREETPKEARKRKLMDLATSKGLVKKAKTTATPGGTAVAGATKAGKGVAQKTIPQAPQTDTGVDIAAAAVTAYRGQQKELATAAPPAGQAPNGEWTQHLEKSNRLSAEDRERVRQFFVDRTNPTPDVPVYRLKLHEEKSAEPGTGLTVKETLYLELDYNTFGFKKLRKIKKK